MTRGRLEQPAQHGRPAAEVVAARAPPGARGAEPRAQPRVVDEAAERVGELVGARRA